MKLEDLLSTRSNSENTVYDFSELTRDELAVFVNSEIYGEETLSDEEMKLLESGTAKIKTRPGKPRKVAPLPPQQPGEPTGKWLQRVLVNQWEK